MSSNIYENQGIGQFIFQLGMEIVKQEYTGEGSVNLLQQTPLDPAFGDAIISTNSYYFLIEFKLEGSEDTEAKKSSVRKLVRHNLENSSASGFAAKKDAYYTYASLSCECHWLCQLYESKKVPDGKFSPYLTDVLPTFGNSKKLKYFYSFDEFIKHGIFLDGNDSKGIGLDNPYFSKYLEYIFSGADNQANDGSNRLFYVFEVNKTNKTLKWSCAETFNDFFPEVKPPFRIKPKI